jgi:hypothetical protein
MRYAQAGLSALLGGMWVAGIAMLLSMTGDVPSASATMSCDYSGSCGGGGWCRNTICSGTTSCVYSPNYQCSMTASTCTNSQCS